jgi:hypothetical protein
VKALAIIVAAIVAACGRTPTTTPPSNTGGSALVDRLDAAKRAHGDVLIFATDDGIAAYTPDLAELGKLTATRGRHLRVGPGRALYFFAERKLVRLDLASAREQTIATLPPIRHRCFPADTDPSERIEDEHDFAIAARGDHACFVAQDRNDNMMSVAITYRIALDTGAVAQQTTFALDECLEPGEQKAATAPCTPQAPADFGNDKSPSGRWTFVRDVELGEQGDYIYAALFLVEKSTGKAYAITPDRLVAFDYAQAKQQRKRPDRTCIAPGEATIRWLDHSDVLIVEGCIGESHSNAIAVVPPASVRALPGSEFAVY